LLSAGAHVDESTEIEVSPLVTYEGEGLEGVKGKTVKGGYAGTLGELEKFCV
jgi:UDP-N-acetylglucosamine/UDP-N-acetylgalactosamine diphosphorylase